MSEREPLHTMQPTARFTDRVADYVRYRPTYPRNAIDAAIDGLGDPRTLTIADIGAGTGISTRLFASTGARTIGIEPNDAMRDAGANDPANLNLRIEWRSSTAEATGLADNAVDVVACAQAFHWFRPAEALAEFHRILRPTGRVALIWNDRDTSDPLSRGYSRLINEASDGHAAANDHTRPNALYDSSLFTGARELRFSHTQELDLSGLIGRATSASYIPKSGPKLESLTRGLTDLFTQHEHRGRIRIAYITRVFIADRLPLGTPPLRAG